MYIRAASPVLIDLILRKAGDVRCDLLLLTDTQSTDRHGLTGLHSLGNIYIK